MTARETRRDQLFALAFNGRFTKNDVMDSEGWSTPEFNQAVRDLRLWFATTDDKVNLAAEPAGHRQPWEYFLTGDFTEARGWIKNRERDLAARLETAEAVAATLVNATSGRTVDGRKVRKVLRTLSYLRGELADLDGQG